MNARDSVLTWKKVVGKKKLKALREAGVSEKKKRVLWITKKLDDEQLAEVYYRIFEGGESFVQIARTVRDIWGINPTWKLSKFVGGLETWYSRLATSLSDAKESAKTPNELQSIKRAEKAILKFHEDIDVLKVLGGSIKLFTERMLELREHEVNFNKNNKLMAEASGNGVPVYASLGALTNMFPILNQLCGQYAAIAERLGVTQLSYDEMGAQLRGKAEEVMTGFIGNDGNMHALAAMRTITALSKHAVDMSLDSESGKFVETHNLKDKERVFQYGANDIGR